MSFLVSAVVGSAVVVGSAIQSNAANDAADAQVEATRLGIDETRAQSDKATEILAPYVASGYSSLNAMNTLTGLNGEDAYNAEISRIEQSPEFLALMESGEDAILANASATGGLRGGDTQRALSEFRPTLLANQINEQYDRLGGITQIGQASAAGEASAAINTGQQISGLYGQIGAARAGDAIAQGNIATGGINAIGSILGGGF